jgi:uroporphyrinogen-III synthase
MADRPLPTVFNMPDKITILSTRPLETALVETAKSKDIIIDIVSFIDTTPVKSANIHAEIKKLFAQPATVVFTSMNAVNAVATHLNGEAPSWNIFSIGNTTRQLATRYFGEAAVIGTGHNATDLADAIIANRSIKQVIFFCGDQRRQELPGRLRQHGITVQEIIVYHTTSTPHKVNKSYDGILFFSPSAVQSFFHTNPVLPTTVLFAIGQTTADAIQFFTHENTVIVSEKPGKEDMVKKMFEYFKK